MPFQNKNGVSAAFELYCEALQAKKIQIRKVIDIGKSDKPSQMPKHDLT